MAENYQPTPEEFIELTTDIIDTTPENYDSDDPAHLIGRLQTAIERIDNMKQDLVYGAVTNGNITRVRTAEILHVHPLTISRWITAREIDQEPS